jgi:hypothetical protein
MRHIKLPSPTNHPKTRKTTTPVWGYILLVATFLLYLISMYAIVVSKLMPDTGNYYLDAIKHDWYNLFFSFKVLSNFS